MRLRTAALLLAVTACSRRVTAQERGAIALGEAVEGLGVTTRVLMIAAHPDDEDTRLIAWLARGQHVETAYLSLTRGDGGQNLIGNELGEALGVIRTQELLAARRIDGAHQYFTRAYDFGFSKSAEETYTHWPHDSLLGDVVQIVRAFRPHVIIAVFTGTPQDGHGQHQVSALLAREAYDVSGDTLRFPVAKYGVAWTVSKFYRDRSYFGGGADALKIQVGEYNPLIGESYSEIASRSRSQHRSQGFGQLIRKGPFTASVYREASRVNSGPERSMFDGIDTTFARLRPFVEDQKSRDALDSLPAAIARVRAACDLQAPEKMLGPLATVESIVKGFGPGSNPDVAETWTILARRTMRALALASSTALELTVPHDVVATGDVAHLTLTVYDRARLPIELLDAVLQSRGEQISVAIAPDSSANRPETMRSDSVTQPWWLVRPRVGDLFGVPVSTVAEDQRFDLNVGDNAGVVVGFALDTTRSSPAAYVMSTIPVQRIADPSRGEIDRPLAFVPMISVTLDQTVEYIPAATRIVRTIPVLLRSASDTERVVAVSLTLPKGLIADSASRHTIVPAYGTRTVEFRVTGMLPKGEATLSATAELDGKRYPNGYVPIEYEHIRPQRLYRDAAVHLIAVDVRVPAGLTVGYIAGVGDNVAPTLGTLGIPVTMLDPAALGSVDLSKFGAIVVGTRAYQASADLKANNRRLLDYARNGGTLVVQYGQYEMADGLMPYPITLARPADRVTDENAPVRILDAKSPILNAPNRIADADWVGWVQERSTYMPRTFDSHYHTVISINDPGEQPNDAGILVAPIGKGTYVYATLAFFRQLPAGVPGAARLFVNLLAAGRTQVVQ